MLLARDGLQKALRQLDSPASGFILSATYSSPHDSRGDVENVLFYNVGSGAFERVANRGLKFERIHRMPAAAPSGRSFAHHHRYSFVAAPQRPTGKPAASFDFELDGISSSSKAYEVWWAASGISASSSARITGKFELHVELACPRSLKAASIVKPLLDGIISAMHSETEIDMEAGRRLCAATGWRSDEVLARLCKPGCPVLGPRRLLSCYRDFVKWNPADDLCEACTLLLKWAPKPTCSVWVFALQSAGAASAR